MLASSRKPSDAANPRRRAKTPALQSPCKRVATQKRQPFAQACRRADEIIGPYAEGAWRQGQPVRQLRVFRPPHSDLRERVGV